MDTNEVLKMLRAIANGQSRLREDMDAGFEKVYKRIDQGENSLSNKIDQFDKKLTTRIDKLGQSIAYLEDDTPTSQEFEELDERVVKLESGFHR